MRPPRLLSFAPLLVAVFAACDATMPPTSNNADLAIAPTPDLAAPPTCTDRIQNGGESDIDCGGGACPHCGVGRMCRAASDCGTSICKSGVCVDASCTDGVLNGSESDVDCGGVCPACAAGKMCRADPDCADAMCRMGACVAPSCTDGKLNAGETDVDCGGPNCPDCAIGSACVAHSDCDRSLCTANRCAAAPSCKALRAANPNRPNGMYSIDPAGTGAISALCDMTADGGGWTLIFHHDITGGYFTGAAEALFTNAQDPTAKRYSLLKYIDAIAKNGPYLFRIEWPGHPQRNVWLQSTNPTKDVNVAGYAPLDLQTTANGFGGLELGSGAHGPGNGNASFLDGTVNSAQWYYAIGSFGPWGNPPGMPASDDVAGAAHGVPEVRLWLKDAEPVVQAPPAGPAFHYFDINHILSTGQSLSVGAVGNPPLSLSQPFMNRMFNTGVLAGGAGLTGMLPLTENGVETMSAGMANLIARMARADLFGGMAPPMNDHALLVSCHGVGGIAYSGLKRGTAPYSNGMAQVASAKSIADRAGYGYVVRAVTNVHGESDHVNQNMNYANDLVQWQSDYETDVKAMIGQREPIPMLHTQISSWTRYNSATSAIPALQLAASDMQPDKIYMVGPKYFLSYVPDGVHLDNKGYRWMGEYYAKAYRRIVLEGKPWIPVRPTKIALAGAEITITFNVPAPPLVLDTMLVTDPGNNGFEYWDDSGSPPAITQVALTGPDTVKITLAKAPAGNQKRVRYAYTGKVGALAGPTTGPRGNLRDSDKTASLNGNNLYNWCVHFDEVVP